MTQNEFYNNADTMFESLRWYHEPTKERRLESAQKFLEGWLKLGEQPPLDINYRHHHASNISLCFSGLLHSNCEANILPLDCPKNRLIVENAVIITDDDLNNEDRYKNLKPVYDQCTDLFIKSMDAKTLPLDIQHLEDFCFSFSLVSHPQSRLYLHEKPYGALQRYAQEIFLQKPVWLHEEYEWKYDETDEVEDHDILASDSMSTLLTKDIIQKTLANKLVI